MDNTAIHTKRLPSLHASSEITQMTTHSARPHCICNVAS